MKVIVVGAGIGGLAAAIGLRRAGHEVLVRTIIFLVHCRSIKFHNLVANNFNTNKHTRFSTNLLCLMKLARLSVSTSFIPSIIYSNINTF